MKGLKATGKHFLDGVVSTIKDTDFTLNYFRENKKSVYDLNVWLLNLV